MFHSHQNWLQMEGSRTEKTLLEEIARMKSESIVLKQVRLFETFHKSLFPR